MLTITSSRHSHIAIFLCMALLFSTLLGTGVFSVPISAADPAQTAEVPAVRFTVTDSDDGYVTLSYELKGRDLARVQCAALAYDSSVLTLVSNDRSKTEIELYPEPGALMTPDAAEYLTYRDGWSAGELGFEYGKVTGGTRLLVLYAASETAVTLADFTAVVSLTFAKAAERTIDASAIRLWNYEEQRAYGQSVKLLTATERAHFTFGALDGGDTMADAVFVGNTAAGGDRGEDTHVPEGVWVNRFSDVADDAPYYDAIAYVCKNNLFLGSSETTFDPGNAMTRATFATVLCRLAGKEAEVLAADATVEIPFTDVKPDAWYTPYVLWAYDNGIFKGRGDGTFAPELQITHQEMYVVIERFTKDHNYYTKDTTNVSVASIADVEKIDIWALEAVRFAFANGILIADANRCIRPTEAAFRWELAVLLESLSELVRTETEAAVIPTEMAGNVLDSCPPASDSMVRGAGQKIYEGLLSLSEKIDISAFTLNKSQFIAVYQEYAKQAELFYVGNPFHYQYDRMSGAILTVTPTYTMQGSELIAAQSLYLEKMNEILSGVDTNWTDFEKVLYLHDYLATHFVYDMELGQYDTYTFLSKGRGICQNYTLVMRALLTTLGIENSRVTSEKMNHTWNLVKIGGKWYHLDVTWDDPQPDQWGQVQHLYFLKSDAYMQAHEHYDWTGFDNITCTDKKYDSVNYTSVRTPFVPYKDGYWYYIENETGVLYRRNFNTGKKEAVYETDMLWYADSDKKLYYQSMYTGLIRFEDILIYNTQNEVIAYHLDSGVAETIARSTNSIYGVTLQQDAKAAYVVYEMKKSPSEKTGTYQKVKLGQVFTYSLVGDVRGYFTDTQVKISLLRNGGVYQVQTAVKSGVYQETNYAFTFEGVMPGRYDLLVEKKGAFSYTVKNIDVNAYTDLSALIGFIPLITGDLNADGVIDASDRELLCDRMTFRRSAADAKTPAADLNGDGIIDIIDYAILTDGDTFGKTKEDCITRAA